MAYAPIHHRPQLSVKHENIVEYSNGIHDLTSAVIMPNRINGEYQMGFRQRFMKPAVEIVLEHKAYLTDKCIVLKHG